MSAPILSIRDPDAINLAVEVIQQGELVIVPTDTIYGIVTLRENKQAIQRLYEIRNREPEPALPLLISTTDHLSRYASLNKIALQLSQRFWPGPLTLILPPKTYGSPVALRVPNFPLLLPLLNAVGGCLFTSGAILSGHSPAITVQEASAFFGDHTALILDGGPSPYGLPSTIIDCTRYPPLLIRHGSVPEDKIRDALGANLLSTMRFQSK